jgi:hypothetical protein
MKRIVSESLVDGFELQVQPEWDSIQPPLTDTHFADWTKTPKYSAEEILDLLKPERLPILSVHGSRDIGSYLCSNKKEDFERGKQVTCDTLFVASKLNAGICVFHLWDTRATSFSLDRIKEALHEVSIRFPSVKASVENIPTSLKGYTPFALVKEFDYVTLDLRWAAMYDEFDAFQSIVHKLVNIHLRGTLSGKRWVMNRSSFSLYEALGKIKDMWGYNGLVTLEREGTLSSADFNSFAEAMTDLRKMVRSEVC